MSSLPVPRPIATLLTGPVRSSEPPPLREERAGEVDEEQSEPIRRHRVLALRVALAASAIAIAWVLWPYVGWLVLAAWIASLARPALEHLAKLTGGRRRAAGIITVGLLVVVAAPIVLVLASLAVDAVQLVSSLTEAPTGDEALRSLVRDHEGSSTLFDRASVAAFLRANSDQAVTMLIAAAGSVVNALLGFMVLFGGAYSALVHGPALFVWVEGLAPASHRTMVRMRDAFVETGRGLLIGSGLTGLVQAILATILYAALGVPRALVLGFLTLVSSVIPGVGTALVWVPVTAGLVLAGNYTQASLMGILGTVLVSGIDNLVRPFFVRWGKLALSPFVVMVSVFGGLAAAGPWGIVFGPIVVRLGLEVLRIARDERAI